MTKRSKFVFQTVSPVREQSVQNVVLVPQNPLILITSKAINAEPAIDGWGSHLLLCLPGFELQPLWLDPHSATQRSVTV